MHSFVFCGCGWDRHDNVNADDDNRSQDQMVLFRVTECLCLAIYMQYILQDNYTRFRLTLFSLFVSIIIRLIRHYTSPNPGGFDGFTTLFPEN